MSLHYQRQVTNDMCVTRIPTEHSRAATLREHSSEYVVPLPAQLNVVEPSPNSSSQATCANECSKKGFTMLILPKVFFNPLYATVALDGALLLLLALGISDLCADY